jgi:DNA-binding MarR family transcriptional regulator
VDGLFGLFGDMRQAMHLRLAAEASVGLAPMHLRVLQLCAGQPGLTQQALARCTGRDKGQIANLVKGLCEQGMLQRIANSQDKRSRSLHVTVEGHRLALRFEALGAALGDQLFAGWSGKEVDEFVRRIEELRARLEAVRAPS